MVSIYDVKNVLSIQVTLNFNKLKVKVNFKFSLNFNLKITVLLILTMCQVPAQAGLHLGVLQLLLGVQCITLFCSIFFLLVDQI